MPEESMAYHLDVLRRIAARRDLGRLILALKELVPEYNPSASILQRMMEAQGTKPEGAGLKELFQAINPDHQTAMDPVAPHVN
jgi:hypothetical protein